MGEIWKSMRQESGRSRELEKGKHKMENRGDTWRRSGDQMGIHRGRKIEIT